MWLAKQHLALLSLALKKTSGRAVFFILISGYVFPFSNAFSADSKSQPIISRITVRGTDIFDLETKSNLQKFPYTWINFLHIETKEFIIRSELLFKVGDRVDPFLLRETERNLRALSFIQGARIVSFPQRDGSVALVVHANDGWTTEPQFNASGTDGVNKVEIGFKEKNFLGLGKTVQYFHNKKNDISENEVGYFDPHLFGTRWQLDADNTEATNGSETTLRLVRPFYATDVLWSGQSNYSHEKREIEEFSNNVKISEFRQTRERSDVSASYKIGKSRDTVNHAGLRYLKERTTFEPTNKTLPGQVLPEHETRQTIFVDLERFRTRFVEMTQLEKMTRIEDLNLGAKIRISPGYAPRDLTGQKPSSRFEGNFEKYTRIKKKNLLYSLLTYSSRDSFEDAENEKFNFSLKYYHRGWPHQTLVVNNRIEWGQELDTDNLIELGNENGLRAFKNVAFRGSKAWLVNVEDRIYLADDLWELVSVGAAVFFDSGYVWEQGQAVAMSDMRSDAGVGLRFALTRASSELIVRLDMAYRMQSTTGDDTGWVFSFGSGQAF